MEFLQSPFALVSPEQISRVNFVLNIIEGRIISVCNDATTHIFKLIKVINYFRWLFLGAESACPMKRKSPVRRQEIMHVLSPKGGEAARRL